MKSEKLAKTSSRRLSRRCLAARSPVASCARSVDSVPVATEPGAAACAGPQKAHASANPIAGRRRTCRMLEDAIEFAVSEVGKFLTRLICAGFHVNLAMQAECLQSTAARLSQQQIARRS